MYSREFAEQVWRSILRVDCKKERNLYSVLNIKKREETMQKENFL